MVSPRVAFSFHFAARRGDYLAQAVLYQPPAGERERAREAAAASDKQRLGCHLAGSRAGSAIALCQLVFLGRLQAKIIGKRTEGDGGDQQNRFCGCCSVKLFLMSVSVCFCEVLGQEGDVFITACFCLYLSFFK